MKKLFSNTSECTNSILVADGFARPDSTIYNYVKSNERKKTAKNEWNAINNKDE